VSELVLAEAEWTARELAHRQRVQQLLGPHEQRVRAGEPHPVWDFLFRYYNLRPAQLRRWHPGHGVVLVGDGARKKYLGRTGYGVHPAGVTVTREHLLARADTVRFIAKLLRATAARPARLNCFGLHEWAMVYRTPSVRHGQVPMRLGAAATDAVVESMPLRCSHFDAFRFFTAPAARRNAGTPTRSGQTGWEQPGCLHTNMDLYKWCYKLLPLLDSDIVMDAFKLACAARVLDMRASPYDLREFGYEPLQIETPSGRAEYVRRQAALAERAAVIRQALLGRCRPLLAAADPDQR
jgi:hypothetical protein